MKYCCCCKINKELSEFCKNKSAKDGLQTLCKCCTRKNNNTSYEKHKDKKSIYRKNQYKINKAKELCKNKEWKNNNKEKYKELSRIHYQKNKKEINLKRKIYTQNNSKVRVDASMRSNIRAVLNAKKAKRSWKKLVGYSINDLILHLESNFTKGMNWDNYGKNGWEVDHIIPKVYFKYNSAEHPAFKACWALSNLQPLWGTDDIAKFNDESSEYLSNRTKGDRITITDKIQKYLDEINKF